MFEQLNPHIYTDGEDKAINDIINELSSLSVTPSDIKRFEEELNILFSLHPNEEEKNLMNSTKAEARIYTIPLFNY